MPKLLRSGDGVALLQAYEEDQRNLQFQPVMGDCQGVSLWSKECTK